MTFDELQALERTIAAKRDEREVFNQRAVQAKSKAKELSEGIRRLEAQLPAPRVRKGIVLKADPSSVSFKPSKG